MCVCVFTILLIYTYVCILISKHLCIRACLHAGIHTSKHTDKLTYIQTCKITILSNVSSLDTQTHVLWCSVLQCVAVCCSMLQCVAVCCSVLSPYTNTRTYTRTHMHVSVRRRCVGEGRRVGELKAQK